MKLAPENLERFRRLVLADPQLLEKLRKNSDLNTFITLTVRLGAERGCIFTADQVRAALQESRRAWLERWI
ncbi:MAG TPA: hypothetical protein VH595_13270 [Verrucomicrobiae bacterium]|nr:hypothetical protein [Verrucomicrobiae bacterium]